MPVRVCIVMAALSAFSGGGAANLLIYHRFEAHGLNNQLPHPLRSAPISSQTHSHLSTTLCSLPSLVFYIYCVHKNKDLGQPGGL